MVNLNFKVEERPGKHRFIHDFKPPKGLVCAPFPVFSWATGCPYECHYCYLYLTLRMLPRMTVWTDYGSMAAQVDSWAGKSPVGSCLNAGELADSLAFGDYSLEMLKTVLPVLSRYPGRELYLLTKSTGEVLDGLKPESFVTVGFSVNAEEVGAAYEKGAPLPSERLAGAKRLRGQGWRIKIRLDPMIPVDGWERAYGDVIRLINELAPEKVTLGSLRFNPSLPGFCPKSDIWRFASERESGGKLRIDEKTSLAMYRFALERLEPKVTSVCKESPLIWKGLGPGRLNCVCLA